MATDEVHSTFKQVSSKLNQPESDIDFENQMSAASISVVDSVSKILSRPYLLFTGVIPSLSAVNTVIYESQVAPTLLNSTGTTRLKHLSEMFRQWNGEITLRFRFTKTLYVEGKLIMAFIPGASLVDVAKYSVGDLVAQESSMIVNLANCETADYVIPFISTKPWLDAAESTGVFTVRTFQPLVLSVTNAANIPFAVEVFVRNSGRSLNLRYLTSLQQNNTVLSDFTAYDRFNTADMERGVADVNIQSPTVQRGALLSMGVVPPSYLLTNINSNSPLYQMPPCDFITAGGVNNYPTYWSSTGHFGTRMERFLYERLNSFFMTPFNMSVSQLTVNTSYGTYGELAAGYSNRTDSLEPYISCSGGTFNTLTYGSSTINGYALLSVRGSIPIPMQLTCYGRMRMVITIETSDLSSQISMHSLTTAHFSIAPNRYGHSQFRFQGPFQGYCVGISNAQGIDQGVGVNKNITTALLSGRYSIHITRISLYNATVPRQLSIDGELVTKLRAECATIPPAFPQILVYSMVGVADTLNMFATWISSTSYSHSEQLSFNTQAQQAARGERRDTNDSFFDKLTYIVSDLVIGNTVVGDILTIAGYVMEFIAILAAPNGNIYLGSSDPMAFDLANQAQLVTRRVNKDKTIYMNTVNINAAYDDVHPLRALRAKQYNNFVPVTISIISQPRVIVNKYSMSTLASTIESHHSNNTSGVPYMSL